jgi:hypothetical protein
MTTAETTTPRRVVITAESILHAIAVIHHPDGHHRAKCAECATRWPCRTVRILTGRAT